MSDAPASRIESSTRHYAVFISYRHADNVESGRKWANWLQDALEGYVVPPELVGTPNLRGGKVPASLYPVFRDEAELPADADLANNIKLSLERSDLLVVLCSPRAVQSRYVAEEIRYFKELGHSSRVLALMIDGEPNAGVDPEKTGVECLPEPLRFGVPREDGSVDWSVHVEPIAADARPGGLAKQGWTTAALYGRELKKQQPKLSSHEVREAVSDYEKRLQEAVLKIVAGGLGVPFGELTQRDQVRALAAARQRGRVLMRLAAGFAVLAVAAAVAGGVAWVQKQRADVRTREVTHTRSTADDLISNILHKLRTELEQTSESQMLVPSTRLALTYFENLPATLRDGNTRRNLASCLTALSGQLVSSENEEDKQEARRMAERALALFEELKAEAPDDVVLHRAALEAEIGAASMRAVAEEDAAKRAAVYKATEQHAEKIWKRWPDDPDNGALLLAAGHVRLFIELLNNRTEGLEAPIRKLIKIAHALAMQFPDRRDLRQMEAEVAMQLAMVLGVQKDNAEAMIYAVASRRIFDDLLQSSEGTKPFKLQALQANALRHQATLYIAEENQNAARMVLTAAAEGLRQARNELEQTQDTLLQENYLTILMTLGAVQSQSYLKSDARDTLGQALEVVGNLAKRFMKDPERSLGYLEKSLQIKMLLIGSYAKYDDGERATALASLQELSNQLGQLRDGGLPAEFYEKYETAVHQQLDELRSWETPEKPAKGSEPDSRSNNPPLAPKP